MLSNSTCTNPLHHGDTTEDSHESLPTLTYDLARLRSVEMKPFEAAIVADVASILVAHLLVPGMEPQFGRPATAPAPVPASCSKAVVGYLRQNMGYAGLVMVGNNPPPATSLSSGTPSLAYTVHSRSFHYSICSACLSQTVDFMILTRDPCV